MNYYCLWCDAEIILRISWENVFQLKSQEKICTQCKANLERIKGSQCEKCARPYFEKVCHDCKKWSHLYAGKDPLIKNVSVFMYNPFMKEIITRWKYQGDYVLIEMFANIFRFHFKKSFSFLPKQYLIVPIPLSEERLLERGFNQADQLASFLPTTPTPTLKRHHSEKQAKKTRMERMTTKNPFKLQQSINKPVILVDDIYTTGRTLRHAAVLLQEKGCQEIYAYTLIRS